MRLWPHLDGRRQLGVVQRARVRIEIQALCKVQERSIFQVALLLGLRCSERPPRLAAVRPGARVCCAWRILAAWFGISCIPAVAHPALPGSTRRVPAGAALQRAADKLLHLGLKCRLRGGLKLRQLRLPMPWHGFGLDPPGRVSCQSLCLQQNSAVGQQLAEVLGCRRHCCRICRLTRASTVCACRCST